MEESKHEVHMMGAAEENWAMSCEEGRREALRRERVREGIRIPIVDRGIAMGEIVMSSD